MSKTPQISQRATIKTRAQKYVSKGNYNKALGELQRVFKLDPMDLRASLRVGDLLQKLGRTSEAVARYNQLTPHYDQDSLLIKAISLNKIILRIDRSQEGIDGELADLYVQTGISSQIRTKGQKAEKKLPQIPLFSEMNRDELRQVVSHLKPKQVAKGDLVCKEGDPGDSIYAINSGKAEVLKYSKKKRGDILLATLREGDLFGEISRIFSRPLMASVRTSKATYLLALDKADFDHVVSSYPPIKGTLEASSRKRLEVMSQIISSSRAKRAMAAMV